MDPPPTLRNVRLRLPEDAVQIVEAVAAGFLDEFCTRLSPNAHDLLRPGDVFVYSKGGRSEIVRWTDGAKRPSASRTRQGFLCYILPANPPARPYQLCRKTYKHTFDLRDGTRETWHLVAYDYDEELKHGQSLRYVENVDELRYAPRPAHFVTPSPEMPFVQDFSHSPSASTSRHSLPPTQQFPKPRWAPYPSPPCSGRRPSLPASEPASPTCSDHAVMPFPSVTPSTCPPSPASTFSRNRRRLFREELPLPDPAVTAHKDASNSSRRVRTSFDMDMLGRMCV